MSSLDPVQIPPPWRDRGFWIGVPIAGVGLVLFAHQLRQGAVPLFSSLLVLLGLGAPLAGWKQREKFLGWRLYYTILQFAVGLTVIGLSAYVSTRR